MIRAPREHLKAIDNERLIRHASEPAEKIGFHGGAKKPVCAQDHNIKAAPIGDVGVVPPHHLCLVPVLLKRVEQFPVVFPCDCAGGHCYGDTQRRLALLLGSAVNLDEFLEHCWVDVIVAADAAA